MKPKELRIGNLVFDKKQKRIVTVWGFESNHDEIFVNYAQGSGVYFIDLKYIEPIPLTEEWLLKFGFEKEEIDTEDFLEIKYKKQINEEIFINYSDDFSCSLYYNEARAEKDLGVLPKWEQIKTVHGLQNLHFALTGEELTLNY
jgi:hypothetical protein